MCYQTLASVCEFEKFLLAIKGKLAVKCDWNSKIFQNLQNLELFLKKWWVFFEKKLEGFQNR